MRGVSNWFDKEPKLETEFESNDDYIRYLLKNEKQRQATRDFPTVEDHDNYLIDQINKRVKSTDTLWHLGDFGFGFNLKDRFVDLRNRIKCETINLCIGNHDHIIDKSQKDPELVHIKNCFKWIGRLHYGKVGGRSLVLCHYSMKTWPWQHHKSIQLFGHSHSNLPDDPNALSMDVGVDTELFGHEKYTPYSISEIFNIMDSFKGPLVFLDHHTPEKEN